MSELTKKNLKISMTLPPQCLPIKLNVICVRYKLIIKEKAKLGSLFLLLSYYIMCDIYLSYM